ncbi:MAG: thioredoxin family protein [Sulfurimonas sp.]
MKRVLAVVFMLMSSAVFASEHMLQASLYKDVQQGIGQGKPYFLEVGSESCHSCKVMGGLLYKMTQKHPHYSIYFIDVKREREAASMLKVMMIPTQIIYDKNGKEVYRHIGVLSKEEVEKLFRVYQF